VEAFISTVVGERRKALHGDASASQQVLEAFRVRAS
jgi:hypothetical protein